MADRDNFRRAWEYAVAHSLATELSEMVRGLIQFSYSGGIGIQPAALTAQAIHSLQQRGVPEIDKTMLHLKLVELEASYNFV